MLNAIAHKKRGYTIINKTDSPSKLDLQALKKIQKKPLFKVSAKDKIGIDEIKKALYDDFIQDLNEIDPSLICNARQIGCLKEASQNLQNLKKAMQDGVVDDVLSVDLKQAILKLGELTGDDVTEEVLDGIFSRFCVGK